MSTRTGLWVAFLFVGAISAVYEVVEWLLSMMVATEIAADYNGQQGDPWDAQKDMAIAMLGGLAAALWQVRPGRRASLSSAISDSTDLIREGQDLR